MEGPQEEAEVYVVIEDVAYGLGPGPGPGGLGRLRLGQPEEFEHALERKFDGRCEVVWPIAIVGEPLGNVLYP